MPLETTDASDAKTKSVAQRAERYYYKRRLSLNRRLARASTAREQRDLRQALEKLESGWQNASFLRECLESRSALAAPSRCDGRIGAGPKLVRFPQQRSEAGTKHVFTGYAARFNEWSVDLGGYIEELAPGCFANTLKRHKDIMCLYAHDWRNLLGRTTAGSLRLAEDKRGLRFWCDELAGDCLSDSVLRRVERRDLQGCSFGFWVKQDQFTFPDQPGGLVRRRIMEIGQLFEISMVANPAYPSTSVTIEERQTTPGADKRFREWLEHRDIADAYEEAGRIIARCRPHELKAELAALRAWGQTQGLRA